jgi:transposase-like protein
MTNRDIKSHLERVYNVEVSPELIDRVTDAMVEDVRMAKPAFRTILRYRVYLDGLSGFPEAVRAVFSNVNA